MSENSFRIYVGILGAAFTVFFAISIVPAFLETWDIIGAFAAGFVNPFSTCYSVDVIICGLILAVWIIYERTAFGARHGLAVFPLMLIPG